MISYALLAALGFALNARDQKMLAVTSLVAAGVFVPIADQHFYLICMLVEILVGALAYMIAAPASLMVVRMSAMLFLLHALGWVLDGYPPESPYHVAVKFLEHAELVMCCLFSRRIFSRCFHV